MNRDDIIKMAHEAGLHLATEVHWMPIIDLSYAERFAALVAAAERNKVAQWMIDRGYATRHGDTVDDLLKELEWQVKEQEREACAAVVEQAGIDGYGTLAAAVMIRAGGEK